MDANFLNHYLIKEGFTDFNNQNIFLHEQINQLILDSFLNEVTQFLINCKFSKTSHKKAYAVIVEGIENSMRHQNKLTDDLKIYCSLNFINNQLKINIGNYIESKNVPVVTEKLELLKQLDSTALKNLITKTATNKKGLTDKGGASVGFPLMILKSTFFDFKMLNIKNNDYFVIHFTIN